MKERRKDYPEIIKRMDRNGDDIISIKEYFNVKVDALEDKIISILDGQKTALEIAREGLEKRLDGMNEFRATLKDQASTFLTCAEFSAKHELIQKQVDDLRLKSAILDGKADQKSVNTIMVLAIITVFLTIIGLFFTWLQINKIEAVSYGYKNMVATEEKDKL